MRKLRGWLWHPSATAGTCTAQCFYLKQICDDLGLRPLHNGRLRHWTIPQFPNQSARGGVRARIGLSSVAARSAVRSINEPNRGFRAPAPETGESGQETGRDGGSGGRRQRLARHDFSPNNDGGEEEGEVAAWTGNCRRCACIVLCTAFVAAGMRCRREAAWGQRRRRGGANCRGHPTVPHSAPRR